MKLLVAIIFSTIAFLSSASKGSDVCTEKNKVDQVLVLSQSDDDSQIVNQESQAGQSSQKNTLDCQICHLGHCDFTITSRFNFVIFVGSQISYSDISIFSIYDFHSGLFRPPILATKI